MSGDKPIPDEIREAHEQALETRELAPDTGLEITQLREDLEAAIEVQIDGEDAFVELNPYLLGLEDETGWPVRRENYKSSEEEDLVLGLVEELTGLAPDQVREVRPEEGELLELKGLKGHLSLYVDREPEGRIVRLLAKSGKTRDDF